MLTKTDIAALRHGTRLVVDLSRHNPAGLVRVIKEGKRRGNSPFADPDQEHIIESARVKVDGFYGKVDAIESGAARCFEMVYLYHGQRCHASSVVKTLRVGDEITFRFWPNANRNGYVKDSASHLHCDVLYLDVTRKGKRYAEWHLDHGICENNSARMCYGFMPRD